MSKHRLEIYQDKQHSYIIYFFVDDKLQKSKARIELKKSLKKEDTKLTKQDVISALPSVKDFEINIYSW